MSTPYETLKERGAVVFDKLVENPGWHGRIYAARVTRGARVGIVTNTGEVSIVLSENEVTELVGALGLR